MSYLILATAFILPWAFAILASRRLGVRGPLRNVVSFSIGALGVGIALILSPSEVAIQSTPATASGDIELTVADAFEAQHGTASSPRQQLPHIPQKNQAHEDAVHSALQSPEAAYHLSLELMECADLDRLIEEHGGLAARLNNEQLLSATAHLEALSAKCMPILGMSDRTAYDLILHAANSGVLEAQLFFPAVAASYINSNEKVSLDAKFVQQFKDDAVRFARSAANTGSPDALYHAYTVFSDGLFTEPNNKAAYHYLSEYLRMRPNHGMDFELQRLASELRSQGVGS